METSSAGHTLEHKDDRCINILDTAVLAYNSPPQKYLSMHRTYAVCSCRDAFFLIAT